MWEEAFTEKPLGLKHCVCNSFVIWVSSFEWRGEGGGGICVGNTLKDETKTGQPPRRPLGSHDTASPYRGNKPREVRKPLLNAHWRFYVVKVRFFADESVRMEIFVAKEENKCIEDDRERAKEWTDRCLTNIVRRGRGAAVFSLLTST